jgi:hypothetical protein
MNTKSKFAIAISSTVIAGALALGAAASAAGSDHSGASSSTPGTTSGRQHLTTQQKCDKVPQVEARVATAKQRIEQRLATLQANKAKADAAGNTVRSQRIQQRIDRLTTAETRIDTKVAKIEAWATANCGTTTPTAAPAGA